MNVLFIISTDDAETSYNAMRLANVAVKKGDDVSVFMLGKGVLFEKSINEEFNIMEQVTLSDGVIEVLPNFLVYTGKAQYGKPEIQKIFEID